MKAMTQRQNDLTTFENSPLAGVHADSPWGEEQNLSLIPVELLSSPWDEGTIFSEACHWASDENSWNSFQERPEIRVFRHETLAEAPRVSTGRGGHYSWREIVTMYGNVYFVDVRTDGTINYASKA